MDHKGRQTRLRRVLARNRLNALLVTHLPNIRYLSGFTGSAGVLLISEDKSVLFTDGRYKEQARQEAEGTRIVIGRKSALVAAGEWLSANARTMGVKTLGTETRHMTVAERRQLQTVLPANLRLREAPPLIEEARIIKESEELDCLRAAVRLGSSLFDVALKMIRPGKKEVEVAAEMEYAARKVGAEGMSFETIIASGPRSALPHGRASTTAIPANGFVVCDFGIILAGYCSDMTRTVHVGEPTRDERRMYDAVREAQQTAMDRVRPGVSAGQVDQAARKVLTARGWGKYFTHSTGHGVGLEIHEMPRLARGLPELLRSGMVITIEPGVYVPGVGGVRIEDMVVVTEHGCEVLTPTSKEMVII
jgi:Xaa-Pro aminopeptidase